jgi:hypothetical protein
VLTFAGADIRQAGSRVEKDIRKLDLVADPSEGTWSEVRATGSGPGERAEHVAVLREPAGGGPQMVTYGGIDEVPKPNPGGGTFTWQSPLLAGGPTLTSLQGAYVPTTVENSAYSLEIAADSATWSAIAAQGQPRTDHSAVWFPAEDAMIVFGGRQTDEARSADNSTWRLTLGAAPAWTRLNLIGGPSKRFAHTAVYDSTAQRMLVFGGTVDWKTGENDVWALSLAGGTDTAAWQRLNPAGTTAPFARYDHGAVYLPALQWMVIFGGTTNGRDPLSDLWALDLSQSPPVWSRLQPPAPRPPGVWGLAAAYSPVGDYAVFYGGQVGTDAKPDAWALKCEAPAVPTTAAPPTATPTVEPTTEVPPTAAATTAVPPTDTPPVQPTEETPTPAPPTPTSVPTAAPPSGIYIPFSLKDYTLGPESP